MFTSLYDQRVAATLHTSVAEIAYTLNQMEYYAGRTLTEWAGLGSYPIYTDLCSLDISESVTHALALEIDTSLQSLFDFSDVNIRNVWPSGEFYNRTFEQTMTALGHTLYDYGVAQKARIPAPAFWIMVQDVLATMTHWEKRWGSEYQGGGGPYSTYPSPQLAADYFSNGGHVTLLDAWNDLGNGSWSEGSEWATKGPVLFDQTSPVYGTWSGFKAGWANMLIPDHDFRDLNDDGGTRGDGSSIVYGRMFFDIDDSSVDNYPHNQRTSSLTFDAAGLDTVTVTTAKTSGSESLAGTAWNGEAGVQTLTVAITDPTPYTAYPPWTSYDGRFEFALRYFGAVYDMSELLTYV